MESNLYEILGVDREATGHEIKNAYKKLSRKYHPDISEEKDAESMMAEINAAYDILGDPDKRADYDYQLDYHDEDETDDNEYPDHKAPKPATHHQPSYYYYSDSVTTKVMSWFTVIVGIMFWIGLIIFYSFNNWSELIDIASIFKGWTIGDLLSTIILVLIAFMFLYLLSFIFVYMLMIWIIISLSMNYDSFIFAMLVIYGGMYLSMSIFFNMDEDLSRWLGLTFLLILIFDEQIKNHFILCLLIGGLVYSILVSWFIFWPLMKFYSSDYVEVNHIWLGAILLPVVGALTMFIAYAIEEWL